MIYMIAGLGVVKIGYTNDVKRRLSTLQTGHTRPLKVIRLFEGGPAEEATLHALFADVRTKGEWFQFVPEMLGNVGLVEVSLTTLRRKPSTEAVPPSAEDDGFDRYKTWLIKAFGSLKNGVTFLDLMALPWIEHRLREADALQARQSVAE